MIDRQREAHEHTHTASSVSLETLINMEGEVRKITQYMVLFIKKYPRDKSIHKAGQWLSRTGELGELGELEAVTKR